MAFEDSVLIVDPWLYFSVTTSLGGRLVFRKLFSFLVVTSVLAGLALGFQATAANAAPVATCPSGNAAISSYSYVIKDPDGTVRTVKTLINNTIAGDQVTVTFKIAN